MQFLPGLKSLQRI